MTRVWLQASHELTQTAAQVTAADAEAGWEPGSALASNSQAFQRAELGGFFFFFFGKEDKKAQKCKSLPFTTKRVC